MAINQNAHSSSAYRLRKVLAKTSLVSLAVLFHSVFAQPIPYDKLETLIPSDPAMQGYTVDNYRKRYKVHKELPERVSVRIAGSIDGRFSVGRLIADSDGNYWNVRPEKIVVIDSLTGDIKPSPYTGAIKCFKDGNIALTVDNGRQGHNSFQYGKFGTNLQVWEDTFLPPQEKYLNLLSCSLEPKVSSRTRDGLTLGFRIDLLPEHGRIGIVEGAPRPGYTPDLPDAAKTLMQQPFTRAMEVSPSTEQWFLMRPDGSEITIPGNPGETMTGQSPNYLPFQGAYFFRPSLRNMLPPSALARPVFGRLIYPDGRIELFGIPDIIQKPRQQDHLYFSGVFYTKAGLVWNIVFKRFSGGRVQYQGDLEEGHYLQDSATKRLLKLPALEQETSPKDGCTLQLKREVVQRTPWMLFNTSHINVCTDE
jgi:hypothetical protein